MKKIVGVLAALILLCVFSCALASVELNKENFPDENFRKYLSRQEFDKNQDGILSDSEIAQINDFDVQGLQISNLKGLEYLTSIWRLACRYNYISKLDVSCNTNLTAISCYGNSGLTMLDVSNCPALVNLVKEHPREGQMVGNTSYDHIFANGSTYMSIPKNMTVIAGDFISRPNVKIDSTFFPDSDFRTFVSGYDTDGDGVLSESELEAVTEMDCSDRNIDNLRGIEQFYKLEKLICGSNRLESIDVSKNAVLKTLDCSVCAKTYSLKLNAGLKQLYCQDCRFWKLDVSQCTGLEVLHCYENPLTELDVSQCPVLCGYMNDNERVTDTDGYDCFGNNFVFNPDVTVTGDFVSEPLPEPTEEPTEEPTAEPTVEPTPTPVTQVTVKNGVYEISGNTAIFVKPKKTTLTGLVIADTVKADGTTYKVTEIKASACKNMKKLSTLTIGKNVKTIGRNAFSGCVKLTAVKGGAALTDIGDAAFKSCKVLTKFVFNTKVQNIGKNAFNGCAKLKSIVVKTTKLTAKTVGANAFKGIYKKATFKCPAKKLKDYKTLFVKKGAPKTCMFKK